MKMDWWWKKEISRNRSSLMRCIKYRADNPLTSSSIIGPEGKQFALVAYMDYVAESDSEPEQSQWFPLIEVVAKSLKISLDDILDEIGRRRSLLGK